MSEILLKVTRGGRTENIHCGDIAVVDYNKKLIKYVGNPYKRTFIRSSAKPLQAMAVVESGAYEAYGLNPSELAVMCSSHYAEPFHIDAVSSIFSKIGLTEDSLLLGKTYSLNEEVTQTLCRAGKNKQRIFNNCSGKHAGMLAISEHKKYDLKTYDLLDHPVQQMMLETVADLSEIKTDDIGIGTDGCGVPVFELPLFNMALSYAKLANTSVLEGSRKKAADLVVKSMKSYPQMVAGTGGFCSELMAQSNGKVIGKLGAEAVYCVGLLEKGIGIAVKIEDGNVKVLSSVVMEVLKQLDVLDVAEMKALESFHIKENINTKNEKVGEIRPVFTLTE